LPMGKIEVSPPGANRHGGGSEFERLGHVDSGLVRLLITLGYLNSPPVLWGVPAGHCCI
jgi:hypothetical protein